VRKKISSTNLDAFIEANKDLLQGDVTVISDGGMVGPNQPSIIYALRGMVYMELEVKAARADLHSGMYGGTVHNPAQALCEIMAKLHKPDGRVSVPGFYDKVRKMDDAERKALAQSPYTEEAWHKDTGARPTLEVNGLLSGFTGKGAKTVLPAKAMAKISCRLVGDQDPYEIEDLVRKHVQSLTPPTVTSEVRGINYAYPSTVPINSPAMDAAIAAYERGFGAKPVFMREGGTLPVVATLQKVFQKPVLLMGFGLHDDNAHAPNEKFALDNFYRGITTAIELFDRLSKLPVKA
jgi:acetylornithine deacetylase/succinyl-diaminopimelate desuccinylase-like protein